MFLCLSGISKTFGAWGPNRWWDIDFPMYLFNLTKIWALMLCLWVCQHLPRGVQMFLCVSENSKEFSAWGPNRCWDIDFPTPLYICSSWPSYQVPILHPLMCQHLPSSLKMFLCVSGFSKNLVYGALIDAEILTSPLPHVSSQLGQDSGTDALPTGVLTPLQWSKMFLCVSETSKEIWCMGP